MRRVLRTGAPDTAPTNAASAQRQRRSAWGSPRRQQWGAPDTAPTNAASAQRQRRSAWGSPRRQQWGLQWGRQGTLRVVACARTLLSLLQGPAARRNAPLTSPGWLMRLQTASCGCCGRAARRGGAQARGRATPRPSRLPPSSVLLVMFRHRGAASRGSRTAHTLPCRSCSMAVLPCVAKHCIVWTGGDQDVPLSAAVQGSRALQRPIARPYHLGKPRRGKCQRGCVAAISPSWSWSGKPRRPWPD